MSLDSHLSQPAVDEGGTQPPLHVAAEWAPAYELLMSLGAFLVLKQHLLLELGPLWVRSIHEQLPPEAATHFARKSTVKLYKDGHDQLLLLVHACPEQAQVQDFLAWFGQLTAGAAYEALAPIVREPGPHLPRDFSGWRNAMLDLLGTWQNAYFRHIDSAILRGLREQANLLKSRVRSADPAELIESVTNGLVVEASPALTKVVLVPQYHHRPYNTDLEIQDGVIILYPCDAAVLSPDDAPPARLMRLTRALSDDSRLRMLRFLARTPTSSLSEVARFAGLSQPTVHHHLTQLRAAGLVRIQFGPSGPNRYSLRPHALEQLAEQLGAYLEVTDP